MTHIANGATDWAGNGENDLSHLQGKYLTYALGQEVYGLNILKVIEIIGIMNITAVPRAPLYVKGVINLRGKIIPVVDLRLKFGMDALEYGEKTCIIVVDSIFNGRNIAIGMIVDTVLEVRDFVLSTLAPAPEFGANIDTSFIVGMGRASEKEVVILIDADRALGGDGIEAAQAASSDFAEQ